MKYSKLAVALVALGVSLMTASVAAHDHDHDHHDDVKATQQATTAQGQVTEQALPQAYGVPTSQPRLQDDFYQYINYDYLTTTKLPVDKSSVNNFSDLSDKNRDMIKALFRDLNANYANLTAGSDDKKVIDFYNMAFDFKTRDQLGLKPIQERLKRVQDVKTVSQYFQVEEDYFLYDYAMLVNAGVAQDRKNSDMNVLYVGPAGTGLDKYYFEDKDPHSLKIQQAYKNHLTALFKHIGYSEAKAKHKAELVYNFEKELAAARLTKEEERKPELLYNVYTLEELQKLVPRVPLTKIFTRYNLQNASKIVVSQPKSLERLNQLATTKNLEAMKSQLEYQIVNRNSYNLTKEVYKSLVDYSSAYSGLNYVDPDDELAYRLTNGRLGELVGKIYVAHNFSPEIKADVVKMTEQIRDRYKERIQAVDWLNEATKAKAIKKLDHLTIKIGYPDKWTDYSKLEIKPYSEGGNLVQVREQKNQLDGLRAIAELNQAPDRSKWHMTPQTVNAYYNSVNNEIVFPAAILQEPFYSPTATRAQNLGGIGAVIAHEISHAFDSRGSKFDEKGNLNNWWLPEDLERFQAKVKQAAAMYSKLETVPGYFVNGEISTGEIFADLGGLTVALDIAAAEGVDQKQVFESYARVWRNLSTKEVQISAIRYEHPPGKFRVNYIVNQMDAFYSLYNVQPSDKLYLDPKERLKVW